MIHPTLLNISHYSFLKSALTVQEIVDFAHRHKHKYVVISEINNAYSWIDFYKKAEELNLTPIFGLQINHRLSSLLLIAKNKTGYLNLLKIIFNNKLEEENLEGIILVHLDGEECFMNHPERYVANSSSPNGVLVRENKFLNQEDYEFYCLLRSIDNSSSVTAELSLNRQCTNDYLYFKESIDMNSHLIQNIYKILGSCEKYEIFESENKLNFFKDAEGEFKNLLEEKFKELKFNSEEEKAKYRKRLDIEIQTITEKNFCEYFLIVYDTIKWAKNNDICIGPGRGSVCGSLISYMLNITEIDPIKYGLYFERFLNPERSTIPDIDIDVESRKREALLLYLRDKYGVENVSLISTFQTFKSKNSFREIFKAYEINAEETDYCLKLLSNNANIDFSNIEKLPNVLRNLMLGFPKTHKAICKILNYPKNLSIHAAGVIISSRPLPSFIPVQRDKINISQWNANGLKDFGLVKFDFLALNYLSSLHRIQEKIESHTKKSIIWTEIDEKDPNVYKTLKQGKNSLIFQFEGERIKNLIKKFEPTSILDLALLSAIHRPGASEQIPVLLARKSSQINHKSKGMLFDFLKDTYGLLVYQEQLMKILVFMMGCSFGEADTYRRNISEDEEGFRKIFFEKNNQKISDQELNNIWAQISKFQKYGFNKSHAIAYATISYRLLWLKTYYPEFFYEELLRFTEEESYLAEIQEAGYDFEVPSYGISEFEEFVIKDKKFYFPVSKIFGISLEFEEKFKTIEFKEDDTLEAIKSFLHAGISESDLLLLIRVGYFNPLFKGEETEYFWETNLSSIVSSVIYVDKDNNPIFDLHLNPIETTKEIKNSYKEYRIDLLGINLNKDKINPTFFVNHPNIFPISQMSYQKDSTVQKYSAFLTFAKESKTFRNVPFLWIRLSEKFLTTQSICYFGENQDEIREAAEKKYAVIATIEKKGDFFKATKIKVFRRKE